MQERLEIPGGAVIWRRMWGISRLLGDGGHRLEYTPRIVRDKVVPFRRRDP